MKKNNLIKLLCTLIAIYVLLLISSCSTQELPPNLTTAEDADLENIWLREEDNRYVILKFNDIYFEKYNGIYGVGEVLREYTYERTTDQIIYTNETEGVNTADYSIAVDTLHFDGDSYIKL